MKDRTTLLAALLIALPWLLLLPFGVRAQVCDFDITAEPRAHLPCR